MPKLEKTLKFKDVKPEVLGITFGVFIIVFSFFLMRLSDKIISHPLLDSYIARLLNGSESIVPLTVIVALALFLVKELLEYIRKEKANRRKLNAFKMLIAEELELNYSVFMSIRGTCSTLETNKELWQGAKYEAKFKEAGNLYVHATHDDKLVLCNPISKVRFQQYDKLLVSIAELNEDFYLKVKRCYLKIIELEHLYLSIIKGLQARENGEPFPSDITKSGFLPYALNETKRIEPELKKLYKECTGNDQLKSRLR
jgi:hypothetical protein